MSDELSQLELLMVEDEFVSQMVGAILNRVGYPSVRKWAAAQPEAFFELHEQVMWILEDTEGVGDFEHELERDVLSRFDLE